MEPASGGAIFEAARHPLGAREASRSVRRFLEGHRLDEATVSEWELITNEAAMNAVKHRGGADETGVLRVMVNVWPDAVEVCVDDHNPGFSLPEQPQLPDDDSEGGRGLYIISRYTDAVRYLRSPSANLLVMRRARRDAGNTRNVQRGDSLEETLDMMAEELAASNESLCAIFRVSREFGETEDVRGCVTRCLNELLRITGAEWFLLRQHHASDNTLRLVSSSLSIEDAPPEAHLLPFDTDAAPNVETQAAAGGRDVWFDHSTEPELLGPLRVLFGDTLSGIACPLQVPGRLVGVLCIGGRDPAARLTARDLRVIRSFADFLSIQISHSEARHEALSLGMLQREIAIAAQVQRSLLPRSLPELPGFTCSAVLRPALLVGGDFYDFVKLEDKGTLLVIADVMGKGPAAALFAIIFRSHLHTLTHLAPRPAEMLARLNMLLFEDLDSSDMFVSAQLAWLDHATGQITIASAGHCPALIMDRTGGHLIEACSEGPPLGITRDAVFDEMRPDPARLWHLVMLTDGSTEARNSQGEMIGTEGIVSCMTRFAQHGGDAPALQSVLLNAIDSHVQDAPAADDITLVVLSRGAHPDTLKPPPPSP